LAQFVSEPTPTQRLTAAKLGKKTQFSVIAISKLSPLFILQLDELLALGKRLLQRFGLDEVAIEPVVELYTSLQVELGRPVFFLIHSFSVLVDIAVQPVESLIIGLLVHPEGGYYFIIRHGLEGGVDYELSLQACERKQSDCNKNCFFHCFLLFLRFKKIIALWSEAKQAPLPQGASSIFPSLMANKRQWAKPRQLDVPRVLHLPGAAGTSEW
jgi:hypothetical protein